MNNIKLIKGDCLEQMDKLIKKGTKVDFIITDPPYGTMDTDGGRKIGINGWDKALNPKDIFEKNCKLLRQNGKCVLFSQEPYTNCLINNAIPSLPYSYRAIWLKDTSGNILGCNSAMVGKYEDICLFSKLNIDFDKSNPLRIIMKKYVEKYGKEYIVNLFKKEGRYSSDASARVHASYKFGFNKGYRIDLMDKKMYDFLSINIEFEEKYDTLKDLYYSYNNQFPSVFNLWEGNKLKYNVLEYKKDKTKLHPTQKPIALLKDLILTYSNKNDTILDFTMGSASTGVACLETNRNFIGIELDDTYFDISKNRVNTYIKENNLDVNLEIIE